MFSSVFNKFEHPVTASLALLQQLKVYVTNATVNETIQSHPDYPSLLSISDSLKKWHIENAAVRITEDKLQEMPLPFITFVNSNGGEFITVTAINNDAVTYASTAGGNKFLQKPLSGFIKEWKGVVLVAETNDQSGEENYVQNKRRQNIRSLKIPALLFAGLAIVFLAAPGFFNTNLYTSKNIFIGYVSLLLLKLAGILITSLLLWYEVDKANPALQKICTGIKNTNCNAILGSKQAKIFPWLSWSEAGFFYFTGTFLLLVTGNQPETGILQLVTFLNLLALPYILFSIYYQWRVAKQWCVLCLSVQVLLFLEFVTAVFTGLINPAITYPLMSPHSLLPLGLGLLLPVIFWYMLKPALLKAEEGRRNKRELMRIKYNRQIFETLLAKQKQVEQSSDGLGITIGNSKAANTIVKVCNSYCGPCAKAHPEIEKILEENKNVKVQIIFTATNDEKDYRSLPVKHLLAIAENNEETKTKQALDDWYLADKKDYELFAKKYPMNGELEEQNSKIEAMDKWCKEMEISVTPTFFINGYQLPDAYSIGDLKYFFAE
jgi:uncharacterized membrane protein